MTVFDNRKLFDKEKTDKSLKSIEWETPPEVFNPINDEFHFTLDVAANSENAKCSKYYTKHDDGMKQNWTGEICWCNPPFGRDVPKWCEKALHEKTNGATTVLIIPCKTNTNWWHELVIPHAEVRFLRGRVKFLKDKTQYGQALPWPLAFVIYHGKKVL